jgi:hypothetical protein
MLYTEYQTAAEKHLQACKAALSMFLNENSNNISQRKERQFLLMDIYYLSGYIFECTITYAIYKKAFDFHGKPPFDETKNIKDTNNTTTFFGKGGAYFHNPPNSFAFYKYYSDKLHNNTNHTANYFVAGHNFQNNAELLNLILSGNTIPFICDRDSPPIDKFDIYDLILKWKPEKRYQVENIPLSLADVQALIALADEVYKKVTQEVGI